MNWFEGFKESVNYWLESPSPEAIEADDVWHEFEVFSGDWVEIQNRMDRYESPHIPRIYKDHKYIFKQNMQMPRPEEVFYEQNMDSGEFKSVIEAEEPLPSGKGDLKIETDLATKYEPSGENDFAGIDYLVSTHVRYDVPNGITFLPRILARPLNQFFRYAYMKFLAIEMVERDGEYAIEKTREYFQYLRKYHGEEPIQTKSRQSEFKPVPDEGIFFQ